MQKQSEVGEDMTSTSEPIEVEAEVVGVPKPASDPRRKPTNAEIAAHAANALDAVSGTAHALGADGAAEVTREAAKVARAIPVAVAGVQREVEPAKQAIGGFWAAMERRGWVGVRKPVNMAAMQKRGGAMKVKGT